jgi:hypothetical protein
VYGQLFADDFWSRLESAATTTGGNLETTKEELVERLNRYVSGENVIQMQIGEVMLNQINSNGDLTSKFIPFLVDVRIGFLSSQESYSFGFDENPTTVASLSSARSSLSTSNSLPQFSINSHSTNKDSHNSNNSAGTPTSSVHAPLTGNKSPTNGKALNNKQPQQQYSPPNSPISSSRGTPVDNESTAAASTTAYNLQLDYWTSVSTTNGSNGHQEHLFAHYHHNHHSHHAPTSQKSTTKALFKSLHIYRSQIYQLDCSSVLSAHQQQPQQSQQQQHNNQDLTIVYQIKEKKQKSKPEAYL